MKHLRLALYIFIIATPLTINSQDIQLNPLGTWYLNPSWYNPAISGSKDFNSLSFTYATGNDFEAMVLNGNTRFSKRIKGYYNIPDNYTYRNMGIGYQVFHKSSDLVESSGLKVTGSYHLKLNESATSFLSIGISLQGSMNTVTTSSIEFPDNTTTETSLDPNIDFGVYFYIPAFYMGISSTGILDGILPDDTISYIHDARQYHFLSGFKLVLYRPMKILIEPSVIVSFSDTISPELFDHIHPMLKIYVDNFCIGSYFYSKDKLSVFFRYNYPRFYLGAFFAMSRELPYYKNKPSIELSAGINLSYKESRRYKRFHW
ncbi:MAG: type IX secretion system membrane protein PorP/SprF [Bacteroidales bacterium]|nr:type IX secretion system membrane protein PorP/SprF [Bacteroidales bacterium]